MKQQQERFFHVHLVSDATGETLIAVSRAAAAQYDHTHAIEHIHPMVRNENQLRVILQEIEKQPGIVLFTLVDQKLSARFEGTCREKNLPVINVLDPVLTVFQTYLGATRAGKVGAQHALDANYFKRIEALNFTMLHDDGQLPDDLEEAEVILLGISRTSKTPTCIYLANRGVKAMNIPIIANMDLPKQLLSCKRPLILALVATSERIVQIRQNRLLSLNAHQAQTDYVDRAMIMEELAYTKKIANQHKWQIIDVTRKSIEETAASILTLMREHQQAKQE